jgi:hypothetical protein
VHQSADGEVHPHQAIKLLPHQIRRLAAQHDPRAPQMSLKFVECVFYLPAVVIDRRQFRGGMRIRYDPSGNRVSQGSRSAPVAAACFHISNPKKPRSARHSMAFPEIGQYSLCQCDLAGGIACHSTTEQNMSAVPH